LVCGQGWQVFVDLCIFLSLWRCLWRLAFRDGAHSWIYGLKHCFPAWKIKQKLKTLPSVFVFPGRKWLESQHQRFQLPSNCQDSNFEANQRHHKTLVTQTNIWILILVILLSYQLCTLLVLGCADKMSRIELVWSPCRLFEL
jgi:hypothetical protein